ncbi:N-acetylmuramoyl-L-alanine amidase [Shouchella hunanensis]|uniref:N-acetylmuramoyl-L-alanine amidase n=1 Tax=Shouchella hunanensis TaxID=766894 RepID=A0ABY7W8K2_9BACI|nr:N-acetylmuramoyl-L-alanine amidase [Shouchella hunanensis]WDF04956.1 N-acetylmuramoyl-L-alanine amidase [Shouchella hunanensis]
MKKLYSATVYLLITMLILQMTTMTAQANPLQGTSGDLETVYVFGNTEDVINVYEGRDQAVALSTIEEGTEATVLAFEEDHFLLTYTNELEEEMTGYIDSNYIVFEEDVKDFLHWRSDDAFTPREYYLHKDQLLEEETSETPEEAIEEETSEAPEEAVEEETSEAPEEAVEEETSEAPEEAVEEEASDSPEEVQEEDVTHENSESTKKEEELARVAEQQEHHVFAGKQPTYVYTSPSQSASTYRSYSFGHSLKVREYNDSWFEATVRIDGVWETGYIAHTDVEFARAAQLEGVAKQNRTAVYSDVSRNSTILRSYNEGQILKYRPFTSEWFSATVILNGTATQGFIHADDLRPVDEVPEQLEGYAKDRVSIYSQTSRTSTVLRNYDEGQMLKFRPYTENWYSAVVRINGEWKNGFIHKSDIVLLTDAQEERNVFAGKQPTNVYTSPSKSATTYRSYTFNHALKVRTLTSNWYQATVMINGKWETGYIAKSDVMDERSPQQQQIAQRNTAVYGEPSRNSEVLRSYNAGQVLTYRPFNSSWHSATVILNGRAVQGFIPAGDLIPTNAQETKHGVALQNVNVYTSTSRNSSVLRSYSTGSTLKFKTLNSEWYTATVRIDGEWKNGFIHRNDVTSLDGKTIVLDAGHGGTDGGARAGGMVEKDLNLSMALRTKPLLEAAGARVIMTRSTDVFVTLADRAKVANESGGDIFISIHNNAFDGRANGTETFYHTRHQSANSQRLAHAVQNAVVGQVNTNYRRVAEGNFHVVRETRIPSILLEVGFMDHAGDAAKLRQTVYHDRAARGILLGVGEYFR